MEKRTVENSIYALAPPGQRKLCYLRTTRNEGMPDRGISLCLAGTSQIPYSTPTPLPGARLATHVHPCSSVKHQRSANPTVTLAAKEPRA